MEFLYYARKYKNKSLDTGLCFKFLENKMVDVVSKFYNDKIVKEEPFQETVILPGKKINIIQIRTSIIKLKHYLT